MQNRMVANMTSLSNSRHIKLYQLTRLVLYSMSVILAFSIDNCGDLVQSRLLLLPAFLHI